MVADYATRSPLPKASVYDCKGRAVGISDSKGRIPQAPQSSYPLAVRYVGYESAVIADATVDTVFMNESSTDLSEIVVETRDRNVLHMLAYVREYSSRSTYFDTVFLFREKLVDFMLVPDRRFKFRGWRTPRVLKSKSYYRFTDCNGLDSVSDRSNHLFSWSDWVGIARMTKVPAQSDTVYGKYSPAEIWTRGNEGGLAIDVNVLACDDSRKWVTNLSSFFRNDLDFEKFRLRYDFADASGDSLDILDLSSYSYVIESNGRGHDIFPFKPDFYASTAAKVYILDKEFITVKEAKKWEKRKFELEDIELFQSPDAPPLDSPTLSLVARVEAIDGDAVRRGIDPDFKLVNENYGKANRNFAPGMRMLNMLKQLTGISAIRHRRKVNNEWKGFKKEWTHRHAERDK